MNQTAETSVTCRLLSVRFGYVKRDRHRRQYRHNYHWRGSLHRLAGETVPDSKSGPHTRSSRARSREAATGTTSKNENSQSSGYPYSSKRRDRSLGGNERIRVWKCQARLASTQRSNPCGLCPWRYSPEDDVGVCPRNGIYCTLRRRSVILANSPVTTSRDRRPRRICGDG